MRFILMVLFILPSFCSRALQSEETDLYFQQREPMLSDALIAVRSAVTDEDRKKANDQFIELLELVLEEPGVTEYPFEKLVSMSTVKSPDGAFRIFNWNIEDNSYVHSHYCYVVRPEHSGKKNIIHKLTEDKITITPRPEGTLTPNTWYGALYYNIIPVKKNGQTLYTVLGFNGNDSRTNRKMLDVFFFKGKQMRMGYPMFQEEAGSEKLLRRVFLEYSDQASVTMNLNKHLAAIVFDHLVPEQANLEGMYDFYIPDMTYDGYQWTDGFWTYKEDIIAYNDENRRIRINIPGDTEDEDRSVEVRDEWIDPVDEDSPVDNQGHDATAPIEEVDEDGQPVDASDGNSTDKKIKSPWKSKSHSAIGDRKAERKQNKRGSN